MVTYLKCQPYTQVCDYRLVTYFISPVLLMLLIITVAAKTHMYTSKNCSQSQTGP